jgi:hypothetical protein
MSVRCCPECFDDRGLRKDIIPSLNPTHGICSFCKSPDVDLIEPGQLADVFEMLVSIYEPATDGKSLVEWMKEDWQLFSHPSMDVAHAKELLSEILDDGDIVRKSFRPCATFRSEALGQWETLRGELMHRNRYLLDEALDFERLRELLSHLYTDDLPQNWYRARILSGGAPYTIEEMGAPPKELATAGRANPPGIPYLYLGSQADTAIAEVRPHTGELACVAGFTVAHPLSAVDLRNPRKFLSPFRLEDASSIGQMWADIPFLERLGSELTRPVLPRSAAINYIPSQYLCEFIKKSGYGGVVYRSSVSNGMNLALFAPEKATGGAVSLYNVSRVSVDIELA